MSENFELSGNWEISMFGLCESHLYGNCWRYFEWACSFWLTPVGVNPSFLRTEHTRRCNQWPSGINGIGCAGLRQNEQAQYVVPMNSCSSNLPVQPKIPSHAICIVTGYASHQIPVFSPGKKAWGFHLPMPRTPVRSGFAKVLKITYIKWHE